ncbi:hypothetical protein [Halobacillus sp. H74]|uniref:hypothetical protein n=1 Tax=Halobacillus sp. H74 TaxID=3457436 RepID=UPI003FCC8F60
MSVNLDRFSVPMPSELSCYQVDMSNVHEVEESVCCESCNEEILMEEGEFVESEIWEDEYIHNSFECISRYYKKESDSNGQNESHIA